MKPDKNAQFDNLPQSAADYIRLVIKKMGYRRKVREDVAAELIAHFEDALADCKNNNEKEERSKKLIADFGDPKLLAILTRRAKKRCRSLWRTVVARCFQTVGILFLCLILYCIYLSTGKPTISVNYLQKVNEIIRPVADESLNAAPLYQKAFQLYVEEPNLNDHPEYLSLVNAIGDFSKRIVELTPEEIVFLKKRLTDNNDTIETFKQAALMPYCSWKRDAKNNVLFAVLLPELSKMRNFEQLLLWRAKVNASEGRINEAFDDVLACYRAGRHCKGQRTTIEQLVGIALENRACKSTLIILQEANAESRTLQRFQVELEKVMASDTFAINFNLAKLTFYDAVQRCFTDNGCGSGRFVPGKLGEMISYDFYLDYPGPGGEPTVTNYAVELGIGLVAADRRTTIARIDEIFQKIEQQQEITPWERHHENIKLDYELGFADRPFLERARYPLLLVSNLRPELLIAVSYRNKVGCEAVQTVVATLRYKQDKRDYPDTLEQLVDTGYLKRVPMDPFSDKPLVYKKTDNNFTLYSVGANFIDNGGEVYYGAPNGTRPEIWGTSNKADAVFWPVPENKPKSKE